MGLISLTLLLLFVGLLFDPLLAWDDAALNEELTNLADNLNSVRATALKVERQVEAASQRLELALEATERRMEGVERRLAQMEANSKNKRVEMAEAVKNSTHAIAELAEQNISMAKLIAGLEARIERVKREADQQLVDGLQAMWQEIERVKAEAEQKLADGLQAKGQEIKALKAINEQLEFKLQSMEETSERQAHALVELQQSDDYQKQLAGTSAIELDQLRLSLIDVKNSSAELKAQVQCIEDVWNDEGTILWELPKFADKLQAAKTGSQPVLKSRPFYTSKPGFAFEAELHPYGDRVLGSSYASLFVRVVRGKYDKLMRWSYRARVLVTVYEHKYAANIIWHSSTTKFQKPGMNASEWSQVEWHQMLEVGAFAEGTYLHNGSLFVQIKVREVEELEDGKVTLYKRPDHESENRTVWLHGTECMNLPDGWRDVAQSIQVGGCVKAYATRDCWFENWKPLRLLPGSPSQNRLEELKIEGSPSSNWRNNIVSLRRCSGLQAKELAAIESGLNATVANTASTIRALVKSSTETALELGKRLEFLEQTSGFKVPVTLHTEANFSGVNKTFWLEKSGNCLALPSTWKNKAKSINTHGNCFFVYGHNNCDAVFNSARLSPGQAGHERLAGLTREGSTESWGNYIESLRNC